jgi:predicted transcriptional regulator
MTDSASKFRDEIEAFLSRKGMDPTTFGKRAMNDPKFVFDVREGRKPGLDTVDRVRAFMQSEAA